MTTRYPEILAPAGNIDSFLAALAAGADAIYLGTQLLNARMKSKNFSLTELAQASKLAHQNKVKIYITLNSLLTQEDLSTAKDILEKIIEFVKPDALILQDIGFLKILKYLNFSGELHLSTLANATHPSSFNIAKQLGFNRIVLPRELNLNELRSCDEKTPQNLKLEIFIHGALCYCISGRCYWSSFLGGKSSLRGQCTQPCRRIYKQNKTFASYFSCQDLSLNDFIKKIISFPNIAAWKIEGRKKGPHYVYHTTQAYKLLRDNFNDSNTKKQAEELISHALSRPRTKKTFFLHKNSPIQHNKLTSFGAFVGKINKIKTVNNKKYINIYSSYLHKDILKNDCIRIGNENDQWHEILRISKNIKKNKTLVIFSKNKKKAKLGTPIFLIDRRNPNLEIILKKWFQEYEKHKNELYIPSNKDHLILSFNHKKKYLKQIHLNWDPIKSKINIKKNNSFWLSPFSLKNSKKINSIWWWLPPVIWPKENYKWFQLINLSLKKGASKFILGSPWQITFFKDKKNDILAGPFCNVSNTAELKILKKIGFNGAIISPELSKKDILKLPGKSPLPLGIIISGFWPIGISRWPINILKEKERILSPLKESFFIYKIFSNFWIFPGWNLNLKKHTKEITTAGYSWEVHLPKFHPFINHNTKKNRKDSSYNWNLKLL